MAIQFPYGFKITSNEPVDARLILTAAQLRTAHQDFAMPDKYVVVCSTDDKLYLYDKQNSLDPVTGRFRVLEGSVPVSDHETINVEVNPNHDTEYILSIVGKDDAVSNSVFRKHINGDSITYSWDIIYDKAQIDELLDNKVSEEAGKELISHENVQKLATIVPGATATSTSDINGHIIINGVDSTVYTLPSDVVHDQQYVHTDKNFSSELYTKLIDIEPNAEANRVIDVKVKETSGEIKTVVDDDKIALIDLSTKQDKIDFDHKLSLEYLAETSTRKFFTANEKTKLANIEDGAESNKVDDITLNGQSIVSNKKAALTIETNLNAESNNPASVNAVRDFINTKIAQNSANYVTSTAAGNNFSSVDALRSATVYYYNGLVYSVKNNDYAIVASDEEHNNKQTKYLYTLDGTVGHWNYQYSLGETFTAAQEAALNSGITSDKVNKLNNIAANATNVAIPVDKTGLVTINGQAHQIIPDNAVFDSDYKHITITENSITNGTDVFNKYDDTGISSRVAAIEPKVTTLQTEVSALNVKVGDSTSGLIKKVEDEVVRASDAEAQLGERITNLEARGRFLSEWKLSEGKPTSYPPTTVDTVYPYIYYYKSGDYYIVNSIPESGTKYRPKGKFIKRDSALHPWEVEAEYEYEVVGVGDYYTYDGDKWLLIQNSTKETSFANITGSARSNTSLDAEFTSLETAVETKVNKNTTIAGVSLENNISKETLLQSLSVEEGAEVNTIEAITLNNEPVVLADKVAKINLDLTSFATHSEVEAGLATKQEAISENNKLDYALLSGTPTIPSTTEELINNSNFVSAQPATSANKILKSRLTDLGISSEWGDVTIDRAFTTKVAVGNLPANYNITSSMTLKEILYLILCNRALTGITYSGDPELVYLIGKQFDRTGISVTAVYDNGSTELLDSGAYDISPAQIAYNTSYITIAYGGKSVNVSGIIPQAKIKPTFIHCHAEEEAAESIINVSDGYESNTITADSHYEIPANTPINITAGTCTAAWKNGNKVKLSNIQDHINYKIVATPIQYSVNTNVSNGSCNWSKTSYTVEDQAGTIQIIPDSTYSYPESVTLTNATLQSYSPATGIAIFTNVVGNITLTAVCPQASILSLDADASAAKLAYRVGEQLNLNNLRVHVTYNDLAHTVITTVYPFTGYDLVVNPAAGYIYTDDDADAGIKTIVISGYDKSCYYLTSCTKKIVVHIEVVQNPTKTNYVHVSEALDLTGLKLKVTYDDGTFAEITSGFSTIPSQGTTIVTANTLDQYVPIEISYSGKSTTLNNVIYVTSELTDLEFISSPAKTLYTEGDYLDLTGLQFSAKLNGLDDAIINVTYNTEGCECTPAHGTLLNEIGTDFPVVVKYTYQGVTKTDATHITYSVAEKTIVPWYVGSIANKIKREFITLDTETLLANATAKQLTDTTYVWQPSAAKEIFYIIVADGVVAPQSGTLSSGGLVTPFTAQDFTDASGVWQGTYSYPDIDILGQCYHVYRYYSSGWNVGSDTMIVNIAEIN